MNNRQDSPPTDTADDRGRPAPAARRALVVDDSPMSLRLVRACLERAGWQVDSATSGLGALRAAKARPPTALVTDGLMPGMDGFLLCRAVRADPDLAATPVIIYSSVYNAEADNQLARTAGATALLPKTNDPSALPALLEDILAGRRDPAPLPQMSDLQFARDHLDRLVAVLLNQQVALDRALEAERAHTRALADLDRLRQSLINAVSHELRTPLTVVRGHASLLEHARAPLDIEQGHRHGRAILAACTRLTLLLDDIQLVAHLEDDNSPIYTMPLALYISVASAVATVQGRYGTSLCPIDVDCAEDLWVEANMRHLSHTLVHLLDNAVKHSPEGLSVQITASAVTAEGAVVIRVRDRGPGLPEGDVDRLFTKFTKGADAAMRAARVGVGIGLYISRALVERMGGTVGGHNAPDGGAEFWVRLRASAPPSMPPEVVP